MTPGSVCWATNPGAWKAAPDSVTMTCTHQRTGGLRWLGSVNWDCESQDKLDVRLLWSDVLLPSLSTFRSPSE